MQAAYSKYPNSYNTNVKGLDTLERRVCDRSLYSHRIFTTLWNVPPIVLQVLQEVINISITYELLDNRF